MQNTFPLLKLKHFVVLVLSVIVVACGNCRKSPRVIFQDDFGSASQGNHVENVIHLPPPNGLNYTWNVLAGGNLPTQWVMVDEIPFPEPKKGFWVVPADSGYLEQGGRSHNSVLFAKVAIPMDVENYDIYYEQYRGDNDYIGYVIGLPEPAIEGGIEFGYMIQVPGTDSTTVDAYVTGDLGEHFIPESAFQHQWINHRIKVRCDSVTWFQAEQLMAQSVITGKSKTGYFGIRHRYERGTRYDNVKIIIYK